LILTINAKKDAYMVGVPPRTIFHHQKLIKELKNQGKKFDPSTLQKKVRAAYIRYFS
jgi:hypothetical protein